MTEQKTNIGSTSYVNSYNTVLSTNLNPNQPILAASSGVDRQILSTSRRRWHYLHLISLVVFVLLFVSGVNAAAIRYKNNLELSGKNKVSPEAAKSTPSTISATPPPPPPPPQKDPIKKPSTRAVVTNPPSTTIVQPPALQQPVSQSSNPNSGTKLNTIPVAVNGRYSFYYSAGRQFVTASGVSVSFSQAQPSVFQTLNDENHSLIELAVASSDDQQIVEVGWIVDGIMDGDAKPHLFVYHWVNGQETCYNACGFVQVSSKIAPGNSVTIGSTGTYAIDYSSGNWQIMYNGDVVGYFPGSLWSGTFTQVGIVQIFGEVARAASNECVQMGNGTLGSKPNSANISNYELHGSTATASLYPFATTSSNYDYGSATSTGMNIGGPGTC